MESTQTATAAAENTKETCPICGHRERWSNALLCSPCNKHYEEKVSRAQNEGKVVAMNRMQYAFYFGLNTLKRFKAELTEAESEKGPILAQAKALLQEELCLEGTVTIDPSEWGRRCAKKFQELCGGKEEANRISAVTNFHPKRIASLEAFLASVGEKLNNGNGSHKEEGEN